MPVGDSRQAPPAHVTTLNARDLIMPYRSNRSQDTGLPPESPDHDQDADRAHVAPPLTNDARTAGSFPPIDDDEDLDAPFYES